MMLTSMVRPNVFILGAPKCGTSTLFGWLTAHPDVCGTIKKETFFLMDKEHPLLGSPNIHVDGPGAYAKSFRHDAASYAVRVDATTHHLFQKTALDYIKTLVGSKLIILMRRPEDRVFSSFLYTKHNLARLNKNISFSAYLQLVRAGKKLYPDICNHAGSAYVLENDVDYSRYAIFLKKWMEAVGAKNILPLFLEDLNADPSTELDKVFSWLDLKHCHTSEIISSARAKNITEKNLNIHIHRLALRVNDALQSKPKLKKWLTNGYGKVMLRQEIRRTPEDLEALALLRASYEPFNEELSMLTNKDLSRWR